MVGNGWRVVESDDFERAVAQLGGHRIVDDILAPIVYGLNRNPFGFYETTVNDVRIARTNLRMSGPDLVLAHMVWFRISEKDRTVVLLWVEIASPDDVGIDDDWDAIF